MQIQRTGYQQNFSSAVIAPINNKFLFVQLINLDTNLVKAKNPIFRFIPFAKQKEAVKFLFVDGEDAKIIHEAEDIFDKQLRKGIKTTELEESIKVFQELPRTEVISEEISTPEDLLKKVPMLERFRAFLGSKTIIF